MSLAKGGTQQAHADTALLTPVLGSALHCSFLSWNFFFFKLPNVMVV